MFKENYLLLSFQDIYLVVIASICIYYERKVL